MYQHGRPQSLGDSATIRGKPAIATEQSSDQRVKMALKPICVNRRKFGVQSSWISRETVGSPDVSSSPARPSECGWKIVLRNECACCIYLPPRNDQHEQKRKNYYYGSSKECEGNMSEKEEGVEPQTAHAESILLTLYDDPSNRCEANQSLFPFGATVDKSCSCTTAIDRSAAAHQPARMRLHRHMKMAHVRA